MPLAGDIIRASDLGSDPWAAYTPTWTASTTNPTLGNGTLTGAWTQIGATVHFRIVLTFGSTTNVGSGTYTWTLPTAAADTQSCVGKANIRDDSAGANRTRSCRNATATTTLLQDEAGATVTQAAPFAWATGDTIVISGNYEAA
jgi:hypothetical protein